MSSCFAIFPRYNHFWIKGYLYYKTTSHGYVTFSRYSSFRIFNHPMIYKICDAKYMRQGAFFDISFEPQLIKSQNLANW